MALINSMRRDQRTRSVPNIDPDDGGAFAKILVLLESPGPRAVNSNFVSCCNDDPSARNMKFVLRRVGLRRKDVIIWNVVPWCVSSVTKNSRVSHQQVRDAARQTQEFLETIKGLRAVIFAGKFAQYASGYVRPRVPVYKTFHTGAQSYNHQRLRRDIHTKFRLAAKMIGRP